MSDGLLQATRTFDRAGLCAPPVPAPLRAEFIEQEEFVFTTRRVEPDQMYFFDLYPLEAIARLIRDYAAVCHSGHGTNSYAITYQLVNGPLALFVQVAWGGIYTNNERAAKEVCRRFRQIEDLIEAADSSKDSWAPPAKLFVLQSDFRGAGGLRWLDEPLGDEGAAERWMAEIQSGRDVLGEAAALLRKTIRQNLEP